MANLTFDGASAEQLALYGDVALRNGLSNLAQQLYRAAVAAAIGNASIPAHSRVGLSRFPNDRSAPMLDALEHFQEIDPQLAFVGEGLATWFKIPPFLNDVKFMELADRHAHLMPVANWHWNLHTVVWAAGQARPLGGDFIELGVFKGRTARFVCDYLDFGSWAQTWWLYDNFEGIPEDQQDAGWDRANARAYDGRFTEVEVRERFADLANVKVVRGRVPEVLTEQAPDAISFMHIDLNSAAAETAALDALWDRVTPGGIVLLDDYGWSVARAQRLAEDAWFAERDLFVLGLPTGQGMVIKP